ncbi:MAG TPA: hypothetical protein VNN73_15865 [Blastocatellia bacterium]|nr:hypothetical protein [Blastocatellia bacterium]
MKADGNWAGCLLIAIDDARVELRFTVTLTAQRRGRHSSTRRRHAVEQRE